MNTQSPSSKSASSLVAVCDGLTEALLYGMIAFSLWAFGTTQPWSIRIMNIAGYSLGLIFFCKMYRPATEQNGRTSQAPF